MRQLSLALMAMSLLWSCGNKDGKKAVYGTEKPATEKRETQSSGNAKTSAPFNMETLQISMAELGDFPFLGFPEGLKPYGTPIEREHDTLFVPIKGRMAPFVGHVWRADITSLDGNGDDWSLPDFFKTYSDAITALRGTLVFDGGIDYEEYERYHSKATYMGETGSIGYLCHPPCQWCERTGPDDGQYRFGQTERPPYGTFQVATFTRKNNGTKKLPIHHVSGVFLW